MATEREDCIQRIIAQTGGRIGRKQLEDELDKLYEAANSAEREGRPAASAMAEAARKLNDKFLEKSALDKRNASESTLKYAELKRRVGLAPNAFSGMDAILVGAIKHFEGAKQSVQAAMHGLRDNLSGGLITDLKREGVYDSLVSGAIEDETQLELYERNRGKQGNIGVTKNSQAMKAAEIIEKWQKINVDYMNKAGAWIGSYLGYITRTTYDSDKIRTAGLDYWKSKAKERMDLERTFGKYSDVQYDKILTEMWGKFIRGEHKLYQLPIDNLDDLGKGFDVARKASAHREIHWKDGRAWMENNKEFGETGFKDSVLASLQNGARTTALLRTFGNEPRVAFEKLLEETRVGISDLDKRKAFESKIPFLRNEFSYLDGMANIPVNETRARLVGNWMAIMRLGHLGFMPFTLLGHGTTKFSEMRWHDMGTLERIGKSLSSFFPAPKGSFNEQVIKMANWGQESEVGSILAQYDAKDTVVGTLSRWEERFFKWTGSTFMTTNSRANLKAIIAKSIGEKYGQSFESLGPHETMLWKQYGIGGEAEWKLFNKANWLELNGERAFTPDAINDIPDADVASYLKGKDKKYATMKDVALARAVANFKDDMSIRVAGYFADRGSTGVLEVGAKERALLYGATRPGDPYNIAKKLLFQWKQFPLTMITKVWAREFMGGQDKSQITRGVIELALASTVAGAVANMLSHAARGQNPVSDWENHTMPSLGAAFIRGGAGSILGDFMLGQYSRFGRSFLGTLAGPTISQLEDINTIRMDMLHAAQGHKAREGIVETVKLIKQNTPFINTFYTEMAVDYLFMYRFQEWMNPGYLRRHEQRVKQQSGIEYWLKPSSVAH